MIVEIFQKLASYHLPAVVHMFNVFLVSCLKDRKRPQVAWTLVLEFVSLSLVLAYGIELRNAKIAENELMKISLDNSLLCHNK